MAEVQHGDFVFTQIGSDLNAISVVTEGYRGAKLNHMGVAVTNTKGTFVLEAFPPEVRLTQIDVFLRRSNDPTTKPRFMIGRLTAPFRPLIPAAIEFGVQQRNVPYDDLYLDDARSLYCSELVVDMYRYANGGVPFFQERPMSFRDKTTGEVYPAWVLYYKHFGMPVPEGEPGSNPGDISRDVRIVIVDVVGNITGYT